MKQYLKSEIHPILPQSVRYQLFSSRIEENTRYCFFPFHLHPISGFHDQAKRFLNREGLYQEAERTFTLSLSILRSFFFPKVVVFLPARPSTRPFRSLKPSAVCKWQKRGQPALGLSRARCFTCTLLLNVAVVISIIISVTRGCSAN